MLAVAWRLDQRVVMRVLSSYLYKPLFYGRYDLAAVHVVGMKLLFPVSGRLCDLYIYGSEAVSKTVTDRGHSIDD